MLNNKENTNILRIKWCNSCGHTIKAGLQRIFFLFLNQNICWRYSKEPSQWDGSFEHPNICLKWWVRKLMQFSVHKLSLSKPNLKKSKPTEWSGCVQQRLKQTPIPIQPYQFLNYALIGERRTHSKVTLLISCTDAHADWSHACLIDRFGGLVGHWLIFYAPLEHNCHPLEGWQL